MSYLKDDFLLENETAVKLYETYAKDMPIFDYHCHLSEKQILENLKLCEGTSVAVLEANRGRLLPTNTSGVTGVYRNRRTGRWCAQITFKRKTYYLGAYEKKDDAIRARKRGEGLHENFIAWYYATHQLTEGRP